jgi:hypothetical protein
VDKVVDNRQFFGEILLQAAPLSHRLTGVSLWKNVKNWICSSKKKPAQGGLLVCV